MMEHEHPKLDGFKVTVSIPCEYGDMDVQGHINNVHFIKYFQNARVAYLEQVGYIEEYLATGIGVVVATVFCRFLKPIKYPDVVLVGVRITQLESDRFTMSYQLVSRDLNEVIATGETLMVSFDTKNKKKVEIPEKPYLAIVALEGKIIK